MTSRPLSGLVMSRRNLLLAGAATVVLAACGGDDAATTAGDTAGRDDAQTALVAGFADGFRVPPALVAGVPQRAPLALVSTDGIPLRDTAPDELTVVLTGEGGFEQRLVLPRHADGIPVPYYPMTFTLDDPGTYRVAAQLADPGADASLLTFEFRVVARDEVNLVQMGDPMRAVDTPTVDDTRGVEPLCTRAEPCPFHDVTLTEALAEGRPVAFLISTPGFCQTAICGPVLELLVEASAERPDVRYVHAEVYTDPSQLGELLPAELVTEAVSTYGLEFEPSLALAGADGLVTARLDYTWDRADLMTALATV